jgi:hypothetical protein
LKRVGQRSKSPIRGNHVARRPLLRVAGDSQCHAGSWVTGVRSRVQGALADRRQALLGARLQLSYVGRGSRLSGRGRPEKPRGVIGSVVSVEPTSRSCRRHSCTVRRTPGISCERSVCSTLVCFIPLFCGLALLLITPHSDAVGLHDPQASCERLPCQLANETLTYLKDKDLVLTWETKHQEA